MEIFTLDAVIAEQATAGIEYLQFINAGSLSLGRYALAAGAVDTQTPHEEDEIYYVISGRARIEVAGEIATVAPGSIIFVGARVPHHFFDIAEDLSVLVVFAPEHRRTTP